MSLYPAAYVFEVFGGAARVAEVLGMDRTWVWRWTQPKEKGGTDGVIPSEHLDPLLTAARERDLPLTAEDLIRRTRADEKAA